MSKSISGPIFWGFHRGITPSKSPDVSGIVLRDSRLVPSCLHFGHIWVPTRRILPVLALSLDAPADNAPLLALPSLQCSLLQQPSAPTYAGFSSCVLVPSAATAAAVHSAFSCLLAPCCCYCLRQDLSWSLELLAPGFRLSPFSGAHPGHGHTILPCTVFRFQHGLQPAFTKQMGLSLGLN